MKHVPALLVVGSLLLQSAFAQPAAFVRLIEPVVDGKGSVIMQSADGKSYPVVRLAGESPIVRNANRVVTMTFAHEVIRLDRFARNLLMNESHGTPPEALTAPAYLLLSKEEGGFSRSGFWLQDAKGKRRLVLAGYVDLVVDRNSSFDEIFSHELGHQILAELVGKLPAGPSRKMHQSMTVTDDPTAFDEGYAEHFQPLDRDAMTGTRVRATDLDRLWISRMDTELRTSGVKRNIFIHRKALPEAALDPNPDLYRLFLDDETSTAFLDDRLRNGQQMMASEGVIATMFYRIVNDPTLRDHFRPAEFYRPFTKSGPKGISPYENVNLKLFVAMRRAAAPIAAGAPPMIALINAYAAAFPDEAKMIETIFLQTTRAATASNDVRLAFERAAAAGRIGDIAAFRPASLAAFSLLKETIDRVASGELALDANLGPQLWLLNDDFKIAQAIWSSDRNLPFTLNLNTATEVELMTIPGVDLATARKIVSARDARGFFRSVDDLSNLVPPTLLEKFRAMAEAMKSAPTVPRL